MLFRPTHSLVLVPSRKVHLYMSRMILILSNTTKLSMPLKFVSYWFHMPYICAFLVSGSMFSGNVAIQRKTIHGHVPYYFTPTSATTNAYGSSRPSSSSYPASILRRRLCSAGCSSTWLRLRLSAVWVPAPSLWTIFFYRAHY